MFVGKELQYDKHEPLFAVQYTTIHKAAADNSIAGIQHFLSLRKMPRIHVTDFDSTGNCPIHLAAEKGFNYNVLCTSVVFLSCTKHGVFANILCFSATGCYDAVEFLLKKGSEVDQRSTYGNTPLMLACKENKLAIIRLLFDYNCNYLCKTRAGFSAVHFAAQGDHVDALHLMTQLINEREERIKEEEMNKLLVNDPTNSESADANRKKDEKEKRKKKNEGKSKIDTSKNNTGVHNVHYNRTHEADKIDDTKNYNKYSINDDSTIMHNMNSLILDSNSQFNSLSLMSFPNHFSQSFVLNPQIFEEFFNTKSNNGTTPLHMAASSNSTNCVRYLIAQGITLDVPNYAGSIFFS